MLVHSNQNPGYKSLFKRFFVLALVAVLGVVIYTMTVPTQAEAAEGKKADSTKGKAGDESWRAKPPKLPPPMPFKLPSIETYKLDNGLIVELVEDHRVPFITVNLGIKAGTSLDADGQLGIASMTADMITEGTKKRTSKQIAEEVDFIGGGLKGGADYDFTFIGASSLSGYTEKLFELLSDVVLNPSFPEDELKLNKTNLLQELVMKRSQPNFLLEERFQKVVFGKHPYAVIAPTPEDVKRMNREALAEFHKKHYLPNDSVLVVVGDFDSKTIKPLIKKSFGASAWSKGVMPEAEFPGVPEISGRKIYLVDRPGSVQSSIKLGNLGLKKTDPDYFAMKVANQILGGAAHSRLFLNIREDKGYTYGAYSGFAARKQPGAFGAEAEVRTEVTSPSLQEFLYELERIRNVKVKEQEVKDAKSFLAGSYQLGLETQAGFANRLLERRLYDLPADYLETYTNRIMDVSVDDVRRVARKYIDFDDMTIVVVGDASKIKPDLEYFGPVEVYDTDGKLVKAGKARSGDGA